MECPHDGSVKNLCTNFFRAVDLALGTDYQALYVKSRSSAESMLGSIARVSALHSIGLLVIDEIQHLEKSRSGGSAKMINFFVTLTNVIKVPVLFIGTPKALELFQPTMRSARRAAQFGSLDWGRFARAGADRGDGEWEQFFKRLWKLQWLENPTPLSQEIMDLFWEYTQGAAQFGSLDWGRFARAGADRGDGEWEQFFKRLWKLQWLENPTPLSQEIMDLFWEYTQGIAHIAVALFYLSQARAVVADRNAIDRPLVTKVYKEELAMIHPMISALRSGREETILQYADLDIPRESLAAQTSLPEMPYIPNDGEAAEQADISKSKQLISLLIQMGIGEDIAPSVADQALAENPNDSLFELVGHIKNLEERSVDMPVQKTSPRKSKKPSPVYVEDDLRLVQGEDPEMTYQALRKKGVIIELSTYL